MLGAKLAAIKATVEISVPTMTTGRQPNLLVIALTTPPEEGTERGNEFSTSHTRLSNRLRGHVIY